MIAKVLVEIEGERPVNSGPESDQISATIFAPERTDHGDYFCRVSIPGLLENDKRIAGVDAEQAKELAVLFVRDIFDGFGIKITSEVNVGEIE